MGGSTTLALSEAATITLGVVAVFLLLALTVIARLLFRRELPQYRRYRVGVFVERDDDTTSDDS